MTLDKAIQYFFSIRLHFLSEAYNAKKYNYKVKIKFVPENHVFIFKKLMKTYSDNLLPFYVANFFSNPKLTIWEINSTECSDIFTCWIKRHQALTHYFKGELSTLLIANNLNELLVMDKDYPILMKEVMANRISMETLLMMNSVLGFIAAWDKKLKDDVVWLGFKHSADKYSCFLNLDKPKIKKVMKELVLKEVTMS